ncbi:hypothetical protein [Usitatibacter palustris]|uniref:Uncharacterized protein n=1 Tax=Usitatibacter palustris TaxID=2732487 RepID=A0A6M4H3I0_9PROT|nr:hypothetical protein [Usitatibacter palustris]QJR13263.1 hypothetical protein DSM104440_00045 [Usitatibacter palustris]
MNRIMTKALLAACVLAAPALAHANKHYHVKLCNETAESVIVSYSKGQVGTDQFGDAKPNGITHHKSGNELKPSKCATLGFVVKYQGMLSPASIVSLRFNVGDGYIEGAFSGLKHESKRGISQDPKGMAFHTQGGGEHFTIDVRGGKPAEKPAK